MQDYSQPAAVHKTPHRTVGFVYIIPVGLVVGFIGFAAVFLLRGNGISLPTFSQTPVSPTPFQIAQETKAPQPTVPPVTPTLVVSASASAAMKKTFKIVVLNGSGKAGVAGKAKAVLEEAGYADVTTGNSDDFTFTNVTIRYTKGVAASIPTLKSDLEEAYTIAAAEEADLPGATDIEVIVGK